MKQIGRRYRWLVPIFLMASLPAWSATEVEGLDFKHGIAFFHELKYSADFTHLDYVNPDAPKGGPLVLPTQTSFNTLSPGNSQSLTAPGLNWTLDTLLIRAGDEVTGFYGRLADGIAITEDEMAKVVKSPGVLHEMICELDDRFGNSSGSVALELKFIAHEEPGGRNKSSWTRRKFSECRV